METLESLDVQSPQSDPVMAEYLSTPPPEGETLRWKIAVVMHKSWFEMTLGTALLINSIFLGVELDKPNDPSIEAISFVFLVLFVLELGFRMYGLGPKLFFSSCSNTLDFGIVLAGLIGEIVARTGAASGTGVITVFRLIRLLRVVRIFTTFKDLAIIVASFTRAISGVFWVLVMLLLAVYMFALFARSFVGMDENLIGVPLSSGTTVEPLFGNVPKSFVTMFQILTLDSWSSGIARPIAEKVAWLYLFFMFYVLLSAFGIMNLLLAVFVNSLLDAVEERKKDEAREKRQRKLAGVKDIEDMFKKIDQDGSGQIGMEEVVECMTEVEKPEWSDMFERLEMSPVKFGKLLHFFAAKAAESADDGDDEVSYTEFLDYFGEMDEDQVENGQWVLEAEILQVKAHTSNLKRLALGVCKTIGIDVPSEGNDVEASPDSDVDGAGLEIKGAKEVQVLDKAEVDKQIKKMFGRYDLDSSGTINSKEELEQLVYNLAFKLDLQKPEIDVEKCLAHYPEIETHNAMDEAAFNEWFVGTVLAKASLK